MMRKTLIALTVASISMSGCATRVITAHVVTLSNGKQYSLGNLKCDRLAYSGLSVTIKDIGMPTSVPAETFSIGEIGISQQKLMEATDRVKELDQIQYRMCQNTLVLISKSDNDALIVSYLEASDKTYVDLVNVVRQFDQAKTEQAVEQATDAAVVEINSAKNRTKSLEPPL